MSTERCKALRAGSWGDFVANRQPLCPHCGNEVDISKADLWRLYEEGEHEFDCPHCDEEVTVSVRVSYSFSTEHQKG